MIPNFDNDGNLLPGLHPAEWDELAQRFGITPHRKRLLDGLIRAARSLKVAGCLKLFVDGSFVTEKEVPVDYDCCWEPAGVNPLLLDPVLLDFSNSRIAQKLKYFGELFPSTAKAEALPPRRTFLEFFQKDRTTGNPKGIIGLDLRRFA